MNHPNFIFETDHRSDCAYSISEGRRVHPCPINVEICPNWTVKKWALLTEKAKAKCGQLHERMLEEETLASLLNSGSPDVKKKARKFMALTGVRDPLFWKKKAVKAFLDGNFFPVLQNEVL